MALFGIRNFLGDRKQTPLLIKDSDKSHIVLSEYGCQILYYTVKPVYTTITHGIKNLRPLLTGGHCSEVVLCYKDLNWNAKMVVAVGRWSLFGGGC
jgi:hypothetical protein